MDIALDTQPEQTRAEFSSAGGIFESHAPAYWANGIQVIPLVARDKMPVENAWQEWGKRPIPDDLKERWIKQYPNANIGIPAGVASNLSFVDIDSKDDAVVALIERALPASPWRRVGLKGCVLAYKYNANLKSFKIKLASDQKPIVEVFCSSGQIVAPPSIHPDTGRAYKSETNLWDGLDSLEELPADIERTLREALGVEGKIKLDTGTMPKISAPVAAGGRDEAMIKQAGRFSLDVIRGTMSLLGALTELADWVNDLVEKVPGDDIDVAKGQDRIVEFLVRDVKAKNLTLPRGWDAGLSAEQKTALGLDVLGEDDVSLGADKIQELFLAEFASSPEADKLKVIDCALRRIARSQDVSGIETDNLLHIIKDHANHIRIDSLRDGIESHKRTATANDKQATEGGLEAEIAKLNADFAVVAVGGAAPIVKFGRHPATKKRTYKLHQKTGFFDLHAPEQVEDPQNPGKKIKIAEAWFNSSSRRTYKEGMGLFPGMNVPAGYLNLWQGFSVVPKPGKWNLFYDHIAQVISDGNTELAEFILNWLARMVQSPGEQGHTALVLKGKKGTGKGIFAYWVGQMLLEHYLPVTDAEHITGQFSGHMLDCILLFADEAFFAGNNKRGEILKALITEEYRVSEKKNYDAELVANYLHLIIATNQDWVVQATADERRFCIANVNSSKIQNIPYFTAISEQMKNGGCAAMLHDLLRRDIEKFDPRTPPQTEGLRDQRRRTIAEKGGVPAWLLEVLSTGETNVKGSGFGKDLAWGDGFRACRKRVRAAVDAWENGRSGYKKPLESEIVGTELKRALGDAVKAGNDIKLLKTEDCDRPRAYQFASLKECRAAFMKSQKLEGLWADDDDNAA